MIRNVCKTVSVVSMSRVNWYNQGHINPFTTDTVKALQFAILV